MRVKISAEQVAEVKKARKGTKDKRYDQKLRCIELRGEGKTCREIAEMVGAHPKVVSVWCNDYVKGGLDALKPAVRGGNHRNMSYEAEEEFLRQFCARAEKGEIVEVKEIKAAYEALVGHPIGRGQIYPVLHRHGWRKIMPRSRHPKKASEEEIASSKKLTRL